MAAKASSNMTLGGPRNIRTHRGCSIGKRKHVRTRSLKKKALLQLLQISGRYDDAEVPQHVIFTTLKFPNGVAGLLGQYYQNRLMQLSSCLDGMQYESLMLKYEHKPNGIVLY